MALRAPGYWSDWQRRSLASYDEDLVRQVAGRLLKPRNQWPVEELIERSVTTADNPAVIDRRLQELEPAARQLLALLGHSRQPCWHLGNLVELMMALGHTDGLQPVFALLEAGLLYPALGADVAALPSSDAGAPPPAARVKSFEQWLASPGSAGLLVFVLPEVAARAVGEDLGLPDLSVKDQGQQEGAADSSFLLRSSSFQEADGLEWLLRLAVLWQQVAVTPLRRTQQGGFFKRDAERLGQDPLLNGPPTDQFTDVPDTGFLVEALAELEGVLHEADGEVRAGDLPAVWENGLSAALESLWVCLPQLSAWNPLDGWRGGEVPAGNPFPSAYLLVFLLLGRLRDGAWARPADVQDWLLTHHPYWSGESVRPSRQRSWVETFLLGVAYHLRLVQAAREAPGAGWMVRLSPLGRWLLGLGEPPGAEPVYPQTLLVQPNLEVVAYRQGLSAALIARLSRFAAWKSLGPACTLQLEPETVYRGLELGQSYESIRLTLEQHGTRAVPPAVLDALRTWADKRDRITVYPSATLLEFASAADLNEALARGLPGVRVADTLAVVASEGAIDFRHFRLTGTRDYAGPPERCVTVDADGVTLTVDLARSDLLLETELPRFAELVDRAAGTGRAQYRLTPASLAAARDMGFGVQALETWFQQRAGQALPAAARLLLAGSQAPAPRLERHLVLQVASAEMADGLLQWPGTRSLIAGRLGPTALVVAEEHADLLRRRLAEAGIEVADR